MSISYRRYEILLPRRFNDDGRRVPSRLLTETLIELREQFGAASYETQTIRGQWSVKASSTWTSRSVFSWMWRMLRKTGASSLNSRRA